MEDTDHRILINQAIINTAVRFGIAYTSAQAIILAVAHLTGANPFGPMRFWILMLLPVFIFFGLRYLKSFEISQELSYLSAFRTGSMTSFIGGATSSMLVYLYTVISGPGVLKRHKAEMQEMLILSEEQLTGVLGKQNLTRMAEEINKITPGSLAFDDFFQKIVFGIIISLILAFFFRKRNTEKH